jgi:NAD(P)-dependent dehydrogenase (short-subunit alcohol dehydrogenase family)
VTSSENTSGSRVRDKVVVVTGAARGMGEAQLRLLAAQGAEVIGTDLYDDEGEAVVASIRETGGRARYLHADASSPEDWDALFGDLMAHEGRLDVLVNNAGIGARAFSDLDDLASWQAYLDINATSVFLGTSRAAALMQPHGSGSIVNISSIMGIVGGPGHPGYYASKAAVRNYTKACAVRFGPDGIRVNSVHPGYMPAMRGAGAASDEVREQRVRTVPLRRLGTVDDVAAGVLYLASDESAFVTGTELVIDGGFLAQ